MPKTYVDHKLNTCLCTSWREVPPADIIAALPSPDRWLRTLSTSAARMTLFTAA